MLKRGERGHYFSQWRSKSKLEIVMRSRVEKYTYMHVQFDEERRLSIEIARANFAATRDQEVSRNDECSTEVQFRCNSLVVKSCWIMGNR